MENGLGQLKEFLQTQSNGQAAVSEVVNRFQSIATEVLSATRAANNTIGTLSRDIRLQASSTVHHIDVGVKFSHFIMQFFLS